MEFAVVCNCKRELVWGGIVIEKRKEKTREKKRVGWSTSEQSPNPNPRNYHAKSSKIILDQIKTHQQHR